MARVTRAALLVMAAAVVLLLAPVEQARAAHAVALFGEPKYPASFQHFDYVNPDAPRGGNLVLAVVSTNSGFNSFNPFSLKGMVAPGLLEMMFETLTAYSLDERYTQYGVLADDIQVAPDFSSATFHINPKARFSNGDPVTAEDVKHSFTVLTDGQASPRFKAYFSEISQIVVLDGQTVRFDFARKGRDMSFIAGSLPVFSPKWGTLADGSKVPFDKILLERPIATGPYVIERADSGSNVTYRRNPDYWGNDVPVRRGMFNFERVQYKLYKDHDTRVAALRAREFNFFNETYMRYWCCQYIGKHFDSGELVKEVIPHRNPPSMNGYVVNLRKPRFQDARVREALNYAIDFEWINSKIFDSGFTRVDSYFSGTPLAARGLPGPDELKLLEPWREQLDPAVFGPMVVQPSTAPPGSLRKSLTRALELFAEAGWHNKDGVLRNAQGEPFIVTVTGTRSESPFMDPIYRNFAKLGIVIQKQLTDRTATRKRLDDFNFDFASVSLREARIPGPELWRNLNSQDADVPGSENAAGVKSPVVDALIQTLMDAGTEQEQQTAARALDRVLMHGYYFMPWRYLTDHYLIYNHRLQRPKVLPLFYGANEWAIATWWDGGDAVPPTRTAARGRPAPHD